MSVWLIVPLDTAHAEAEWRRGDEFYRRVFGWFDRWLVEGER